MNDSLGYRIHDLARLIRKRFDEESRDLGVTNSQWRVLVNVFRQPGINQGTLAERPGSMPSRWRVLGNGIRLNLSGCWT